MLLLYVCFAPEETVLHGKILLIEWQLWWIEWKVPVGIGGRIHRNQHRFIAKRVSEYSQFHPFD